MMKMNKFLLKSKPKDSFSANLKKKFDFPLKGAKIAVFAVVLLAVAGLFAGSEFDMYIHCKRSKSLCTITKSSFSEPVPIELGRFSMLNAFQINVKSRVVENGKLIYDIQIDRGESKEPEFIDFGYNTIIKANTAKMKLLKFFEDGSAQEFELRKRCYFNDYFCF